MLAEALANVDTLPDALAAERRGESPYSFKSGFLRGTVEPAARFLACHVGACAGPEGA